MNIIPTLYTIQKVAVLWSYIPVSVLAMQIFPLELKQPIHSMPLARNAATLPITGAQFTAKDTASVVGEYSFADIQRPFVGGNLTTRFSWYHPGIDIAAQVGVPLKPILSGTVVEAKYDYSGYGNTVVVNHKGGLQSRYAHLHTIYVSPGQRVSSETILGTNGNTGRSTGPHLHLEIFDSGRAINPLDMLP